MRTRPANREEGLASLRRHGTPAATPNDDGWVATLAKISPIMSGVGAFGSFINSVIAARQTAEFQRQLIAGLQAVETDLEGIKSDLDAIYQELKDIETEIAGLGLNDKLTSIETWGMEMAALDPDDKTGAANLATAMMDASQGATNLLGCMVGLHNAMVGENIGKPLMTLLDGSGILRIRGRLIQGLHLLAFGCAFNTKERYDYGVLLWQWAANLEQQTTMYFGSGKDGVPYPPEALVGDGVALYTLSQTAVPNVCVTVDGTGDTMQLFTSTAASLPFLGDLQVIFPLMPFGDAGTYFLDLLNNEWTQDENSPLGKACDPWEDANRWLIVGANPYGGLLDPPLLTRVKFVCGARFDPAQTFLGSANGQMAWVGAAADQTTYLCSIHDGNATTAPLLVYDASKGSVSAVPFAQLRTLSPALWMVAWVSKDVVTIAASQPAGAPPAYLTLDDHGNWAISASPVDLTVAAAAAAITRLDHPFPMPPTPATITSTAPTRTKTALFHQL